VLIPCLTLLLSTEQHAAQGMTLFAYLPMAVFALISHIRQKNLHIRPVLYITAFGCAGGVAGFLLARAIEADTLRLVFGVFLIGAALLRVYRQEIQPRLTGAKSKAVRDSEKRGAGPR